MCVTPFIAVFIYTCIRETVYVYVCDTMTAVILACVWYA